MFYVGILSPGMSRSEMFLFHCSDNIWPKSTRGWCEHLIYGSAAWSHPWQVMGSEHKAVRYDQHEVLYLCEDVWVCHCDYGQKDKAGWRSGCSDGQNLWHPVWCRWYRRATCPKMPLTAISVIVLHSSGSPSTPVCSKSTQQMEQDICARELASAIFCYFYMVAAKASKTRSIATIKPNAFNSKLYRKLQSEATSYFHGAC